VTWLRTIAALRAALADLAADLRTLAADIAADVAEAFRVPEALR